MVDTFDDPRWAAVATGTGLVLFTVRGMHRPMDDCSADHRARVWMPDGTVADIHRLWQAEQYREAWNRAAAARFDGTDGLKHKPGKGPVKRKGRRR